jgi:hypothetical protein
MVMYIRDRLSKCTYLSHIQWKDGWQGLPIIKFLLGVLYSLYIVRNYMMRLLSLLPSPPVTGTVVIYRISGQPYSSYANLLKWVSTYVPHSLLWRKKSHI